MCSLVLLLFSSYRENSTKNERKLKILQTVKILESLKKIKQKPTEKVIVDESNENQEIEEKPKESFESLASIIN